MFLFCFCRLSVCVCAPCYLPVLTTDLPPPITVAQLGQRLLDMDRIDNPANAPAPIDTMDVEVSVCIIVYVCLCVTVCVYHGVCVCVYVL